MTLGLKITRSDKVYSEGLVSRGETGTRHHELYLLCSLIIPEKSLSCA